MKDADLKQQELMAKMQEMDERLQLDKRKQDHTEEMDRARLAFDRDKAEKDRALKERQIKKSSNKQ